MPARFAAVAAAAGGAFYYFSQQQAEEQPSSSTPKRAAGPNAIEALTKKADPAVAAQAGPVISLASELQSYREQLAAARESEKESSSDLKKGNLSGREYDEQMKFLRKEKTMIKQRIKELEKEQKE